MPEVFPFIPRIKPSGDHMQREASGPWTYMILGSDIDFDLPILPGYHESVFREH